MTGNSHRRWLALGVQAILILLVGACGETPSGSATPGDAAQGRSLWAQSACAGCHGADAQGTRAGPALSRTPLNIHEFTSFTRRGGPGMPRYSASETSDEELLAMYAWLQDPVLVATGGPVQDPWAQSPCIGCHGAGALGGSGPNLTGISRPFNEFRTIVRQGAGGMPAFSADMVSDQTLQAIYAWLQAQGQGPLAEQAPWVELGCGACHGTEAEGDTAPALSGKDLAYDDFQRVVREGADGMPAYGTDRLSEEELERMYGWLQTLMPEGTDELEQVPWTQSTCATCHGADGRGERGPSLAGTSRSFDEFRAFVRQGAEGMPAYTATEISDQTLQAMYQWLQIQAPGPDGERTLWAELGCGACHGAEADGGSAPALVGQGLAYDGFQRIVREGAEGMPAYGGDRLSDADLERMYKWLTALP